jgi:HK97 family phage portal protein
MVELTIDDLCLTGNSFYAFIRNNFGYPVEMYRLPPSTTVVVKDGNVVGYQVGQGDKKVAFPVEDVLHFKIPDPSNQYLGMGYVAAAAQSLALKNRIDISEHAGLKNLFQPGGVLLLDGQPADENEFKEIVKRFNDAYSGAAKRGKLAAFHGVKELKPFDIPIKDFGFLQGRSDIRNELYSIWKVPLTFGDRKTTPGRATIEADQIGLLEYAVKPHLLRMQEKITESLLAQYDNGPGKLFCEFDIESAMPADREYLLRERETNIRAGYSTPDEERAKMGEEPRPDGAGDVVWVQYGQIPASLAKEMSADILESETDGEAEVTAEDEAKPKPESEPDIDTEGKSISDKARGKAVKKKTVGLPAMTVEKKVTPQMIQMRRGVRKAYGKLLKETIKRVKSAG